MNKINNRQKIRAVLALSLVAIAMSLPPVLQNIKPVFASSNTDKEVFLFTVKNIDQKNLKVSLTINGQYKHFNIQGINNLFDSPSSQVVEFKVARNLGATAPAVNPLKLGDEYTACVAKEDKPTQGACLRSTLDSLTIPQSKTLDAKYIPG